MITQPVRRVALCLCWVLLLTHCGTPKAPPPVDSVWLTLKNTATDSMHAAPPVIPLVYYATPNLRVSVAENAAKKKNTGLLDPFNGPELPHWPTISQTYGVPDPILVLRDKIQKSLVQTQGIILRPMDNTLPLPVVSPNAYANRFKDKYLLDLAINRYELRSLPQDPDNYYLLIGVQARLILLADGQILWQQQCEASGEHDEVGRFQYSRLQQGEGVRLRHILHHLINACQEDLIAPTATPSATIP